MICDKSCEIYPCFVAVPGKECKLAEYPESVQEIVRSFYRGKESFEHELRNMAARIYVKALMDGEIDVMVKVLKELAFVYKILYGNAPDEDERAWERILEVLNDDEGKGDSD